MSDNPLFKKLRLLPDQKVLILNASQGYLDVLGEFPAGTAVDTEAKGRYDLVQIFFTRSARLEEQVNGIKAALDDKGNL